MYYAEIDPITRICGAVTETHGAIIADHMIEILSLDETLLGKYHNAATGEFEAVAPPADPCEWLLDIGPFTDRFGSKKWAVDMSADPFVQAFNRDLNRRKWVDLQDERVAVALNYMAGHTIPGIGTIAAAILTDAEVATFLTTPVVAEENLALRKLYFA